MSEEMFIFIFSPQAASKQITSRAANLGLTGTLVPGPPASPTVLLLSLIGAKRKRGPSTR